MQIMCSSRILSGLVALLFMVMTGWSQTPREAIEHYNRARGRYAKGDIDGAIADYTRAIEISSRLANDNRKAGFNEMASAFDDIRVVDPFTAFAYANRGLMRYYKGDYDGAIEDTNRAIAINPRSGEAYNNRGLAHFAKKDYERALSDFGRAIAFNPRDVEALNNRGNTYSETNEFRKAVADFDKAILLDSKNAVIYYNRALARREINEDAGAMSDFEKAVEINPRLAQGYYGRAVVYCDRGKLDRAIT